ncbi:uncharacterized protein LOC134203959 [Armigeres subalbatus]|uniref:uncharacterized protein LOC134203959 n=1 Tax=Armigeres subalbatus TaxID=124917 RepID=UPI002ED17326
MPRSLKISSYAEQIQLHVLPKLTSDLPTEYVNVQHLAIPEHLMLADPTFFEPGSIDMIIGAEYYYDLLAEGKIKLCDGGPTLHETVFGWVVSGRVPGSSTVAQRTHSHPITSPDLNDLLTKFWELESCHSGGTLSVEESACEEIFERTTIRNEVGRFVVTLPKKEAVIQRLGDSKANALKRFHGLERRFATNSALKEAYFDFIEEYKSMGHMEEVLEGEEPVYYLPHHAVLKPDSTTTKLRVVFDASCRTTTGISLNDGLMVGPVVQDDLHTIALRFRFWRHALVADVAKMYRMVGVRRADQLLQCILWRSCPDEPVKSYKLTTVTYGTSAAPYLATKCLQRLGSEGETPHPVAAKIVKKDFYVDDLLTGTDKLDEGKALVADLIDLTNSAGSVLRKWSSSSNELLSDVPIELRDERTFFELDSSTSAVKSLYFIWEPAADMFRFTIPNIGSETSITKRIVLSELAKIFDPLGLIGPVVVQAKIFLQTLWKQKCDWDDLLPEELQRIWTEFRRNLMALDTLTVPRWVSFSNDLAMVELHGFCDASNAAYGACLYLRCITSDGTITARLITAKSRVAPLEDLKRKKKVLSTPRLVLSAALLLSHLYGKVLHSVQITFQPFFWTDSTIVKYWLASPPSRWQIFVANRVSEIQHITSIGVWNHVAGANNPADIISRGMTPAQLKYETLWFEGPLLLRQDRATVPLPDIEQSLSEERSTVALPARAKSPSEFFALRSSFTDLVRLVAYIRRFVHNCSPSNLASKHSGIIKLQELNEATAVLVRLAQRDSFPEEVAALSRSREVKTSSKIHALNPIMVGKTIRVGGRLAHAPIPESRKHPMILHHRHSFTKLVVEHYHRKLFHAGQQLLVSSYPSEKNSGPQTHAMWLVPSATCFRNKPTVHEQLIADLPYA